jgi:hypothetical protein
MMKKYIFGVLLVLLVLSLSACSGDDSERIGEDGELKWVEVDVKINPNPAKPNEPVTFTANVTYGGKPLTDIKDFSFEVWRSLDEKHEKIEVEQVKDGVFTLEKTFEREGTYYIFTHVTAKNMHNMPKKEFVVGTASEPEKGPAKSLYMDDEGNANETEMEMQ